MHLWCNQQNPSVSRKIYFLLFDTAKFSVSIVCCKFCRKFEPDRPKMRFLRTFSNGRIISNSSFRENSFWSASFFFSWKLDFNISQLRNVIQKRILGRWGTNFWQKIHRVAPKTRKSFPSYVWVLARASCIRFYNTWRYFFKSTFIRTTRQDFVIYRKTIISRRTWTYFRPIFSLKQFLVKTVFIHFPMPCPEKLFSPTYAWVLLIASHFTFSILRRILRVQ